MRKQLSSSFTILYRLLAIGWPIVTVIVAGREFYGRWYANELVPIDPIKVILYLLFVVGGSVFIHFMAGSLKQVAIEGDRLVVSNFIKKIQIPRSNISLVNCPDATNLRRIEINLSTPSEFGPNIIFAPNFLRAQQIADELREWAAA